ncbi:MAG TPA: ABC transporter permease, partial [Phycisphaeraceae bacterium]|nr:ABC transporter permease [Phycisphaeraceae bacterium]
AVWMLSFIAPAITMRLLAGEYRQGTIETVQTSPVADWQVIWGKFLAAFCMLLVMLVPTLVYLLMLQMVSKPDYGPVFSGYLGLLLLGAMYLALGTLASTMTQSLMAAYLGAFFFWIFAGFATSQGAAALGSPWDTVLYACSPRLHTANLAKGVISLVDIVFFLSLTVFFLLLAVRILESRRWR